MLIIIIDFTTCKLIKKMNSLTFRNQFIYGNVAGIYCKT